MSDALGIELFVKREDEGELLGGNKGRKLEYLLGRLPEGTTTLVAAGVRAQTNLSRVVPAFARRLGLEAVMALGVEDLASLPVIEGNLLIGTLLGLEIEWHTTPEMFQRGPAILDEIAARIRARGGSPHVIPLGASGPAGAWATVETVEELAASGILNNGEVTIVHAAASGATGAGLILGTRLLGLPARVLGVDVISAAHVEALREMTARLASQAAAEAGLDLRVSPGEVDVLDGSGAGLGKNEHGELDLLAEVAAADALLLDPVYSIKGFAALARLARAGQLTGRVIFLHTGSPFGLMTHKLPAPQGQDGKTIS